MNTPLSDQDQTRMALATLFGALVEALRAHSETVPRDFERNLERAYADLKDNGSDHLPVLETLACTKQAMKALRS